MSSDRLPIERLNEAGLNRQAVFNLHDLPPDIGGKLGAHVGETQLILLGHGGRRLWERVSAGGLNSEHPIDDYTIAVITQCFADHLPQNRYRILYPGNQPIGLQALGQLAGWHYPSPFMIGIDAQWGSWFAYRAVILSDTHFCALNPVDRTTPEVELGSRNVQAPVLEDHPCQRCLEMPCISACPAGALDGGTFDFVRCSAHRQQPASPCAFTCLARVACPVGKEHRYDDAQLRHSYAQSLQMILRHAGKA